MVTRGHSLKRASDDGDSDYVKEIMNVYRKYVVL